jgi:GTP-binding protein
MDVTTPMIVSAQFVAGAAGQGQLPAPTYAEIAFAGRSNVGKSSLLNTVVGRKNLVRVGGTPGTTRQINFFEVRATDGLALLLVDLPGYGYARRGKKEKTSWGELIEGYLTLRVTLRALVLIVDVRRGLEDDDRELMDFVAQTEGRAARSPVRVLLVATKTDRLSSAARKPALAKVARDAGAPVLGFSAETGEGRDGLWRRIRDALSSPPCAL